MNTYFLLIHYLTISGGSNLKSQLTTLALLHTTLLWVKFLEKGFEVRAVYFDFHKALTLSHRLVFGSSTIDSLIIFAIQLLTASHKQLRGVWGAEPPNLSI